MVGWPSQRQKLFPGCRTIAVSYRKPVFCFGRMPQNTKRYFLGYSSINVSIQEGRDWFDIYANVRFGEFEIPFLKLTDAHSE